MARRRAARADLSRRYPGSFLLVRYEDFTARSALWVERLCAFCELPAETEAMLAMRDFAPEEPFQLFHPQAAGARQERGFDSARQSHAQAFRLDAKLVADVLGPFTGGIGPMLEEDAELPLHHIPEEERRSAPLLSYLSFAIVWAAAMLPG